MLGSQKLTKKKNKILSTQETTSSLVSSLYYRETTRLVTIEHLAKLTFSGVSANQMEFHNSNSWWVLQREYKLDQYIFTYEKREDDTKSRNAVHKFIIYNINMYTKKKKDRLRRNIMR